MKILVSLFFISNVFSASGVGFGGDLRISPPMFEVKTMSGEGYGGNLRTLGIGEYDFDSYSNRWLLKTKSRLLSVRNVELVDKFEIKQFEVKKVSSRLKRINNRIDQKYLESIVKRSVKFKDYKITDFEY